MPLRKNSVFKFGRVFWVVAAILPKVASFCVWRFDTSCSIKLVNKFPDFVFGLSSPLMAQLGAVLGGVWTSFWRCLPPPHSACSGDQLGFVGFVTQMSSIHIDFSTGFLATSYQGYRGHGVWTWCEGNSRT